MLWRADNASRKECARDCSKHRTNCALVLREVDECGSAGARTEGKVSAKHTVNMRVHGSLKYLRFWPCGKQRALTSRRREGAPLQGLGPGGHRTCLLSPLKPTHRVRETTVQLHLALFCETTAAAMADCGIVSEL